MSATTSYIKQKATLAAIRIVHMLPDTIEEFETLIPDMLQDKHHSNSWKLKSGVLMATLTLLLEIFVKEPSYIEKYRKYVPTLVFWYC